MRREDYQPRQTPRDSPFRKFEVRCIRCGSVKIKIIGQHDEDGGEMKVFLVCLCGQREEMPVG